MTPAIEDVLLEELLLNGSITALSQAFLDRHLSVAEAVAFYVARVEALDRSGPTLNSIRALAPDLAAQAQRADAAIADGRALGPLHGSPASRRNGMRPWSRGCARRARSSSARRI
jgi:Asp-tRNA(Asn)/Glu-tRNA(Gln) amidotransferase A subunit family amidase